MKPVSLPELQALLGKLRISANTAELAQAHGHTLKTRAQTHPLEQLRQLLSDAGLKDIQAAILPWRRLDPRRLPALLWLEEQWWLAERPAPGRITLSRDGAAPRECTEDALHEAEVLWLRGPTRHSSDDAQEGQGNPALRMVWHELLRSRGWIPRVVMATLLVNLLAIPTSIFAMQVYDRVVPTMAYATLATLTVGMLLMVGLDWLLKTLRAHILDSVTCGMDQRLSQRVYEHLLRLQLDQQPRSLGTLAAQVGALDSVRQFFSSSIIFALVDLPFALLFIGLIALIGGHIGWVYAGILPVALLIGLYTRLRLRRLTRQQMMRSNERQGLLVDSIRGAESIRASHAGWRFAQDWQKLSQSIAGYSIQQKSLTHFSATTTASLSTLAYVAAIVVGVWQVEAGHLTMGGMIACSILGGRVIAPIAQGVQYLVQWQQVSESLQMVNGLLKLNPERRPQQTLLLPERQPETLAVEQLRFAFLHSPLQLLNLPRLEFKSGERVLLLGPVGGGKSTLLKVLAGLYRPSEGRVRLGDADLWEIDPQIVSTQVGYLPQSVQLFKGTLRSNLALSGAVSDSAMLETARALGLDQIAAGSPQGMDMEISEGGEGLSGGQRQLVGLARVLMARPRIWLLDEPTASLDGDAEARVWQQLQQLLRPEDILIVSTHRPMAAMPLATRVIVLQQGQVSRDGRPDQVMPGLMARAGGAPITTPATPSAAAAPQQPSALQLRQVRVQPQTATPAPTTSTPAATPDAMAAQTQE
ncbi:ATP-binding cassette domain-containing protein [Comamonas aquatilis]|uniref:ATP-binding cassette domain-containing protein n=1 Tax=Comamonas aquatilis TaxID=1778406 RepID=UPI0039EEDE9F